MKLLKYLLTGLLVAGVAASASAATKRTKITKTEGTLAPAVSAATPLTIHIVGSTAYRAPVMQAIKDVLAAGGGDVACYWGSSTFGKANGLIMSGTYVTTTSTTPIVVETFWTGSAAGTVDLAKQTPIQDFMDYSTYITSGSATSGYGTFVAGTPTFSGTAVAPDAAMSDSDEASVALVMSDATVTQSGTTVRNGGPLLQAAINNAGLQDAGTTGDVTNGTVGIIPFEWVLGNPGTVGLTATNITQQVAKQLIQNGFVNFSELTGNSADLSNFALLVGRNEDSGTRIDSAAETQDGFGISPTQVLFSFTNNNTSTSVFPLPTFGVQTGGTGSSIASIQAWPATSPLNTEPTIDWDTTGHSGYVSGGDVANTLLAQNNGGYTINGNIAPTSADYTPGTSKLAFIGYVGIADAFSALSGNSGGNAIALTYNGVTYSVANVQNGIYSLWGFEHMYTTSTPGTVTRNFINAVADEIFSTDADMNSSEVHAQPNAAGIFFNSSMNFTRSTTEGGIISPVK